MDDDGLNMRNWGYYEPSIKGNLGLQLMPSASDQSTRSFLSTRDHPIMYPPNGTYHPHTDPPLHLDYMRENWLNPREKFFNILPGTTHNYNFPNIPTPTHMHMVKEELDPTAKKENNGIIKKRMSDNGSNSNSNSNSATLKGPKPKKLKKGGPKGERPAKKNIDMVINGIDMDISEIPIPVCSCTGTSQQCYRWGCGGWQSACCTTTISMYPLPMSTKRRGARIAGRKMSLGAFKKVLEKLGNEGYDFSDPIDLRGFWAKHGTNKFVTIR